MDVAGWMNNVDFFLFPIADFLFPFPFYCTYSSSLTFICCGHETSKSVEWIVSLSDLSKKVTLLTMRSFIRNGSHLLTFWCALNKGRITLIIVTMYLLTNYLVEQGLVRHHWKGLSLHYQPECDKRVNLVLVFTWWKCWRREYIRQHHICFICESINWQTFIISMNLLRWNL